MRTIAEAVDALVEGNVLRAGDLLIQRFKALETSVAYSRGKCRACLGGRASGHFAVGASASEAHGGGQQEIGNRQHGASRVKFGRAPCESSSQGSQEYPTRSREGAKVSKIGCSQFEAEEVASISGGRTAATKYRSWCRRRGTGKNTGSKSVPQTSSSLEEKVCISSAQAALSANNSWLAADPAISLKQLRKASGGGLSVSSLGMRVLRAVATRASPLGDLVREVLRTSFTLVEASSKSVRQRDLVPLPVPWNWAPFAETGESIATAIDCDAFGVSCTVLGAGLC